MCLRACACMHVCSFVCVCVCVCVHARARVRVCAWARARVYMFHFFVTFFCLFLFFGVTST